MIHSNGPPSAVIMPPATAAVWGRTRAHSARAPAPGGARSAAASTDRLFAGRRERRLYAERFEGVRTEVAVCGCAADRDECGCDRQSVGQRSAPRTAHAFKKRR